jgi:hypothetical protein
LKNFQKIPGAISPRFVERFRRQTGKRYFGPR